jgi:Ser/Thr protein kinase RdoA (MazF antagonist)
VQAFLAHLAARGFAGAPRPVAIDGGREIVTYVPGDVPVHEDPPDWCLTDEALVSVVTLARKMHAAARGFVPPDDAQWQWPRSAAYTSDLIGHNDLCRENVVFTDGRATAFIDFDYAGPTTPEWEVAAIVRHWVLALPGDRIARARLVLDTYPLDAVAVTAALLDRLDWGLAMVRARADAGEPGFVAMWQAGAYERNRALHAWVVEQLPQGLDR